MSVKQDRQGVRTAKEVEQKYNFGKKFAEVLGIAQDARDSVDKTYSELRNQMTEQVTSITRDTEKIILAALESYVETSDLEEFKKTVESELVVMADKISMNFTSTATDIREIDGKLQTIAEDLQKHFDFSVDGLTIKSGENAMQLILDNDVIRFTKNGQEFGWWDGVNFHTGNIFVDLEERAQFGNFAFVPRSDGSLSFLKVGG